MDKTALLKFSYGLYVASASDGKSTGACVVNTGLQVTSDPLQVAVVVNKQNHTCDVIREAGHFALTVLSERAGMPFIGTFGFKSSREIDKFEGLDRRATALSDPYAIENACAVVSCALARGVDVGTHVIFVGEVVDAESLSDDPPMTYSYYHSVLRGKTPPRASSYIGGVGSARARPPVAGPSHHFRCTACGYVWGTESDALPEDFKCPACGFGRDEFERVD